MRVFRQNALSDFSAKKRRVNACSRNYSLDSAFHLQTGAQNVPIYEQRFTSFNHPKPCRICHVFGGKRRVGFSAGWCFHISH